MRKWFSLVVLLTFSWLGQDARAGVTFDVVFQDAQWVSFLTITSGDPGPGCEFGGYSGGSASVGYCMDVILTSTYDMVAASTSVTYDNSNGLVLAGMYEWRRVGVSFDKQGQPREYCAPAGGLLDYGGVIQSFDCTIPEPNNPPVLPAGTYRIGTLVWDTSGFVGMGSTIAAYINDHLEDGVAAVINGNVIFLTRADIVVRSHYLILGDPIICGDGLIMATEECDDGGTTPGDGCDWNCQVEPGWTCVGEPSVCTEVAAVPSMSATGVTVLGVAVFGIGLVGLVIAARRRFS